MRKSLLFLTFLAVFTCAQARYTIITDTIFGSAFYPGTVHTMQVSIPDVADTSKPVGLYLGLDGILCSAPEVLDTLAAQGVSPSSNQVRTS